jgi:hypothetical protein
MAYGTVKVDNITFDKDGVDQNIQVKDLFESTTSGLTVTGTISGQRIEAVSGVITTISGTNLTYTTAGVQNISGGTLNYSSGIFASGTQTNPSITFSGDVDTGFYNPSPNQIGITTSGEERVRIDNVGLITIMGSLKDPPITGTILEDVFTITDGAAFEVDPGNGSVQLITLGDNRTPKATNFAAGHSITLMVDDGSAYTLTWTDATWGTSGVEWTGGAAPDLATTGYTVIQFWKVGTQVYGALVGEVA